MNEQAAERTTMSGGAAPEARSSLSPEPRLDRCPRCRYELAGLPPRGRCPECGYQYDEMMFDLEVMVEQGVRRRRPLPEMITFAVLLLVGAGLWLAGPAAGGVAFIILFSTVVLYIIFVSAWREMRVRGGDADGTVVFRPAGVYEVTRRGPHRCMDWRDVRSIAVVRLDEARWRLQLRASSWRRPLHAPVIRVQFRATPQEAAAVREAINSLRTKSRPR